MNFIKKLIAVYTAKVESFVDFYELKCNLPGLITETDIEVREDLYPDGVSSIFALPNDYGIEFAVWFNTEFGSYRVLVDICFLSGTIKIEFTTVVSKGEKINDSYSSKVEHITEKDLNNLVIKLLPVVESFLNTIDGLKKNHPCEKECYYSKLRKNKGGCDKMYISKSEYTPEEDAMRQRLLLRREYMSKHKYDF